MCTSSQCTVHSDELSFFVAWGGGEDYFKGVPDRQIY